tara:strand:- start:945 stop:1349 length:405 start_codon:yes stop_codon:yes gene_type:complete
MPRFRLLFLLLLLPLLSIPPAIAQKAKSKAQKPRVVIQVPTDPSLIWMVSVGGRGYDDWAKLSRTKLPKRTHPSYPKSGKLRGPKTWLCHSCHGWDYRGKDGAYGRGPNYTGIKGLRAMPVKKPTNVPIDMPYS